MRDFDYTSLLHKKWDNEIVGYLTAIHEERGKQQLYLKRNEPVLNKLVEIAKLQSTESSNEIEGIRTTSTRLKQLMAEKTTPRNRDEKEIVGYRNALNAVHENFEYIPLTPGYILQLHQIMFAQTASGFGGQFKNVQNYISATDAAGKSFVLFTPLAPWETPEAVQRLCDAYNIALGRGATDPLLLIPCFIHDFLCIHPFIDGNGRMSRLLTTLLLYRSGYFVGRYISLEAKIAQTKDLYYDALLLSQRNWQEGKEDVVPFIKYLLGTIIAAYRDFSARAELVAEKRPALEMVSAAVGTKLGKLRKADILELCPGLSLASIERSLRQLCEQGRLERHGSGRTTYYVRKE